MKDYTHFYNNLIKLTRNKDLYREFKANDEFSDRLIFFLIHFAFFFKVFKNEENSVELQDIYDFVFRQLELSIREIGYDDQSSDTENIQNQEEDIWSIVYAIQDVTVVE